MAVELIDPTTNVGDDATATFESDPKFIESTPGSEGSSENLKEQMRDTDDLEDSEEEDGDVDEDEELDDDEDAESEEDLDDDDEDLEDEDEDVEDDDEDLDDDEEDDEDEELAASPALRADGLLGYEDEAEDTESGRSEEQGNAARLREERKLKQPGSMIGTGSDEDDDAGDVAAGIREDEVTDDDLDTDRIAALAHFAAQVMAARTTQRNV